MTNIAGKDVQTNELVIMGTGVAALIVGFLPWLKADVPEEARQFLEAAGADTSLKGFSSGFGAWFGLFLLMVAAGLVAAKIFADFRLPAAGPAGPAVILLAISGAATLIILLRVLFIPDFSSRGFGAYVGVLLAAAQAAFAFLAFKASGEQIPEIGGRNFNPGGGTPPPPAG